MTANKIFSLVEDEQFVQTKGLYDKLIIDCAFKEDISLKRQPDCGCKGFHPTLTTNGMCYTFNGKPTSELWQPSKMINSFSTLFPSHPTNNKTFGGPRTAQGIFMARIKGLTLIRLRGVLRGHQLHNPSVISMWVKITSSPLVTFNFKTFPKHRQTQFLNFLAQI